MVSPIRRPAASARATAKCVARAYLASPSCQSAGFKSSARMAGGSSKPIGCAEGSPLSCLRLCSITRCSGRGMASFPCCRRRTSVLLLLCCGEGGGNQQFFHCTKAHGLDQVMLEPGFPGTTAVLFLPISRDCYQQGLFQSRHLSQLLGHLIAIHPRHADVQEHHLGVKGSCRFDGFGAIEGHPRVMSLQLQERGYALG